MGNVIFDSRWIGEHGIGRFAREVYSAIDGLEKIKLNGDPASKYDSFKLTQYLSKNSGYFFHQDTIRHCVSWNVALLRYMI